jgi:hypothetical protein
MIVRWTRCSTLRTRGASTLLKALVVVAVVVAVLLILSTPPIAVLFSLTDYKDNIRSDATCPEDAATRKRLQGVLVP